MHPFLRDQDFVVAKEIPPGELRRGNILVFRDGQRGYIIHRMIGRSKQDLICVRGDGYNLRAELVDKKALMGKAVGVVRAGRFIRFNRFMEWHSWIVAWLKEHLKNFGRGKSNRVPKVSG